MKVLTLFFLFFVMSGFVRLGNNIEQKELRQIKKLLCGDWSYEYSINAGVREVISDETFINTKVFFRIEFRKMATKELQRFYLNRATAYQSILQGNAFEGIEMFGDYKGCPEYPIIESNSKEFSGKINEYKIQTYGNCGNILPEKQKSFYIEKLTKDSLVISGYMGNSQDNKIVYSKMK